MKYIIITLSILGCLLFPSCSESWLDSSPSTGVETEISVKNPKDAQYALNGIYYQLREYQYYGARMTFYGDVTGDDMQAYSQTKRSGNYYLFKFNKETAVSTFWTYPYKVIRNTNNILDYIHHGVQDEMMIDRMTDELYDIKGQALTLRAMAHFDLVKVYGYPYTKDNGASLGVTIELEKHDQSSKPKRNTVAEVYNQAIIKDLEDAESIIGKKPKSGKLNWYGSQLLLARAYLYMGNNSKAYKVASNLITEAEKNGYKLWANEEYLSVWSKENTSELFFEIMVKASEDGPGNESIGYLMLESGYKDIILTTDFIDMISKDKNDIRYKLFTTISKRNYLLKYPGNEGEHARYANIPVLRLSEAYLIAAEAAVKNNDDANAELYLKAIVKRANPAATLTTPVTLDRVLEERRKELVGEGHRFYDAMRNNKKIERKGSSHLAALPAEAKSFDWNYYKIVMAIPKTEMDANPNMVQNPSY